LAQVLYDEVLKRFSEHELEIKLLFNLH